MRYLALCLLAAGLVVAPQASAAPITVTATLAINNTVSLPPSGRRSDAILQSWRLNDRNGHRVGRMLLNCRWVLRRARICTGEIKMPLGTIQVQGASPSSFVGTYAVVGGTERYEGAGGAMWFIATGARKSVLVVTITS